MSLTGVLQPGDELRRSSVQPVGARVSLMIAQFIQNLSTSIYSKLLTFETIPSE